MPSMKLTEIKTATTNNFDDNLVIGCCGDWKAYNGFINDTNSDPNPNPVPWKRRLKICVGVARGHYLHTGLKHTIVHSGVEPTNILLDAKWEAKLSYLGLSKMGPPSLSKALVRIETDRVVGTYGYMDQENVCFDSVPCMLGKGCKINVID
ncbi:receptor-like protein kinase FERONIA [Quercus lobata]|uniref:Protein kinase domain-containing protein n=1 Tax=Quercus lobata TaxID=97700 RepID=A0A7N2LSR4_QUELO|nr:receptor-like protein kinase FERONIA [Quercus lobata]